MRRRTLRGAIAATGVVAATWAPAAFAGPAAAEIGGPASTRVVQATLTGAAEVDGTGTPDQGDPDGAGIASLVLEQATSAAGHPATGEDACLALVVDGLDDVTMAHIHHAPAGSNGPIVVPLPAPTEGASGGCVAVEPTLLEDIAAHPDQYYVNVHTTAFPAGAVRGQLVEGPSPLTAHLTGAAERDGATGAGYLGDPDAVGAATVLVDPAGLVCAALAVTGTEPPVAGHIHQAGLRANGPVVVPFTDLPTAGTSAGCDPADPAVAAGIVAEPAGFYVNLHTPTYPAGAVRGQLSHGLTSQLVATADGALTPVGDGTALDDVSDLDLAWPVVGVDATPTGDGAWLAAADGGVFALGDAAFAGSAGGLPLNQPVVGVAGTPTADGYWLAASDGGVFSYGDATFHGSAGGLPLNQPVVGTAATPTGRGYWLVASDGGVFSYGDAAFHGSTASLALNSPIVGVAPTASGAGYWLVAADGGVFAFGDATFLGSGVEDQQTFVGIAAAGAGYRIVTDTGQARSFGVASLGSIPGPELARPAPVAGTAV